MKVKFAQTIIQDAVNTAMACVSVKNTIEAAAGILINCTGDRALLTSYDLEKGMQITIDAEITEPGICNLNAQSLNSIIKLMPAGIIELEVNDTRRAKVTSGHSEFEINGYDPDMFPTLPDLEGTQGFCMKQGDLKTMINQTLFAVAQNDSRATFNGALFKIQGNRITTVGCDSFRLAVREKVCELENQGSGELNESFIVPGKALSDIVRLLTEPDESVCIRISRKQLVLSFPNKDTVFFTRLIEGSYIDYERIIPRNSTIFVDIDRLSFESALNRASLVSDESAGKNTSLARCHFYDNKLEIDSVSQNGKVHDELSTSHDGGEITIGFNCRYLLDALKASMCDSLRLSLSSPFISMMIEPLETTENDRLLFLVLPCKIR